MLLERYVDPKTKSGRRTNRVNYADKLSDEEGDDEEDDDEEDGDFKVSEHSESSERLDDEDFDDSASTRMTKTMIERTRKEAETCERRWSAKRNHGSKVPGWQKWKKKKKKKDPNAPKRPCLLTLFSWAKSGRR